MKKGINNACRRTSKTPRLLFTLADITNSDFQIFIYHGDFRSCNGDESGSFQEFFENSNRNSVWKTVKFSYTHITRLIQLNISPIHEFKVLHKGQSAYSWFRVLMSRTSYLLNTYPKLWELPWKRLSSATWSYKEIQNSLLISV